MIDPTATVQTHTSLETAPHVQTHTMLEKTVHADHDQAAAAVLLVETVQGRCGGAAERAARSHDPAHQHYLAAQVLERERLGVEPVLELPAGRGLAEEAAQVVAGRWVRGRECGG